MSTITRRDFLGGTALAIAAGLTPLDQLRADTARYYPPALTGLRGSHPGAFEVAHRLAREGEKFDFSGKPVEEEYDLVVVGGGISGLAAAWFYREAHSDAKILIIENHDDFGGHAKRNEFTVDGHPMLIGYGGSEAMESPRANFSETVARLMKTLAVNVDRFDTAFDTKALCGAWPVVRRVLRPREFRHGPAARRQPAWRWRRPNARQYGQDQADPGIHRRISALAGRHQTAHRLLRLAEGLSRRQVGRREDRLSREHQLPRLPQGGCGTRRGRGEILRGPDARLLGGRHRRRVGLRRDGQRLSGLRRPRPSVRRRRRRALHLSFPGRQRVDRAAADAQPYPGGGGRFDDGRHRAC